MPLLASKLASSPTDSILNHSSSGQLQHNRQTNLPVDPSLLKSSLSSSSSSTTLPVSSPPSSLTSSSVSSAFSSTLSPAATGLGARKTGNSPFSQFKMAIDNRQQPQQQQQQRPMSHNSQLQKQLQQPTGPNFIHSLASTLEPHPIGVDTSWSLDDAVFSQLPLPGLNQQQQQQPLLQQVKKSAQAQSQGTNATFNNFLSLVESENLTQTQPVSQRFVHVGLGGGSVVEQSQLAPTSQNQNQSQTSSAGTTSGLVSKHLRSPTGQMPGGNSSVSQLGQLTKGKPLSQSIQPVGIGALSQSFISQNTTRPSTGGILGGPTDSKRRRSGPGETKQTAIDVDVDFGSLSSSLARVNNNKNISSLSMNSDSKLGFPQQLLPNSIGSSIASDATLVRDITGASLANTMPGVTGNSGELQTFLSIQSHVNETTTSSSTISSFLSNKSNTSPVVTSVLAQIPRPIMHVYSSPTSTAAAPLLPPPPLYNPPPPPYPNRFQQQQQQQAPVVFQQHGLEGKVGLNSKESVPNPFTFPTTGVKVQPGYDSIGHLSYSISHNSTEKSGIAGLSALKEEMQVATSASEQRAGVSSFSAKSQSDLSSLSRTQREQLERMGVEARMPRLCPEASIKMEMKTEDGASPMGQSGFCGHPVKEEAAGDNMDRRPLVSFVN